MVQDRVFLSPPYMGENELKYIQEAFEENWIAPMGKNVNLFEAGVRSYTGAEHAVAVSSGTAGIHLALKWLGVQTGDYVFCSSLTFVGSCNPILYENAIPVFIDSEPKSWNMSPLALEQAFEWAKKENKLPKAVIIVDIYGQSADYDRLLPICEKYNVPVIEDAAEALGATYNGRQCGTFGTVGVFSFNGNKIITTSGGGMVITDDKAAKDKMMKWATQAREPVRHYEHNEVGYNYRLSNISAGIGRGQMEVLDLRIKQKKAIYNYYLEHLSDLPIEFMPIMPKGEPNYWLTVIKVNESSKRDEIIDKLEELNIESRPVWKPMHLQPLFKQFPFYSHSCSRCISEELFLNGLCLPSGTSMVEPQLNVIIETIKTCLSD